MPLKNSLSTSRVWHIFWMFLFCCGSKTQKSYRYFETCLKQKISIDLGFDHRNHRGLSFGMREIKARRFRLTGQTHWGFFAPTQTTHKVAKNFGLLLFIIHPRFAQTIVNTQTQVGPLVFFVVVTNLPHGMNSSSFKDQYGRILLFRFF